MSTSLHVGGLVAAGFDASGAYLLTVSHSGRGVFATDTWKRVARDSGPAYPTNGCAVGIGPIEGIAVGVKEKNYETGDLHLVSSDGSIVLDYDSGIITITKK
jgi:hypothetical protein